MATDQPVLHFPVNDNPQLMLYITFLRLSAGKNEEGRNRPSSYIFRAFRNVDDVTLKNSPRSPLSSTISISKTLSLEKLNLSNL